MSDSNRSYQRVAQELWNLGKYSECGRVLFQGLPSQVRPYWAAAVLNLVVAHTEVWKCSIWELQLAAKHKWRWGAGKPLSDSIGKTIARLQRRRNMTSRQQSQFLQCHIAELVAKVIYNASGTIWPYDEDTGEGIVPALRRYLQHANDPHLDREATQLLFERDWSS